MEIIFSIACCWNTFVKVFQDKGEKYQFSQFDANGQRMFDSILFNWTIIFVTYTWLHIVVSQTNTIVIKIYIV